MFSKLTNFSSNNSSSSVSASANNLPASISDAPVYANGDKNENGDDDRSSTSESIDAQSVELNSSTTTFSKFRNAFSKTKSSKKRQAKRSGSPSSSSSSYGHQKSAASAASASASAAAAAAANFSASADMTAHEAEAEPENPGSFKSLISSKASRKQTIHNLKTIQQTVTSLPKPGQVPGELQDQDPEHDHDHDHDHNQAGFLLDFQQTMDQYLTSLQANPLPIEQMQTNNYEKLVSKIDDFFPLQTEEEYKLFKEQEKQELAAMQYLPVAQLISAHLHLSDSESENENGNGKDNSKDNGNEDGNEDGCGYGYEYDSNADFGGCHYAIQSAGFPCVYEHTTTKFGFDKEFTGEKNDVTGVFETGEDQWEKFMANCNDVPGCTLSA
ncbi:unnamed protein product [Ambrosiozyma monospora]|uniref:Unnamed protein product n=1 Tax=Ambrosiozyma monospora TaxID=43982 RepID=A0A9W6YWP2_AMBMO|nr:unnamed protein product [Ambrosiozyma monospora]